MPRSKTSCSVVAAGYMPLDIVDDGRTVWRRAGGTAGNVAAILAFLEWNAALAGRVGDDLAGAELRGDLDRAGVDQRLVGRAEGGRTTRLVHAIGHRGHRYLYTCPHCEQRLPRSHPLTISQIEGVLAAYPNPTVFFFDRANAATVALAEEYDRRGTMVVFEPSTLVSAALLQRAVRASTIIKGSDDRGQDFVESAEAARPGQLRVITAGEHGSRFRRGDGSWHHVGVFPIRVIDTAGAGDWTTAGLLDHLARAPKDDLETVAAGIRFGHALAALNCAVPGARGLAEHRSRASVLGLATRLRRGAPAYPVWHEPQPLIERHGSCDWCLLELPKASGPSVAEQASA